MISKTPTNATSYGSAELLVSCCDRTLLPCLHRGVVRQFLPAVVQAQEQDARRCAREQDVLPARNAVLSIARLERRQRRGQGEAAGPVQWTRPSAAAARHARGPTGAQRHDASATRGRHIDVEDIRDLSVP